MNAEMTSAGKIVESDQIEHMKYDQGHRVPMKNRAVTTHLHFPFGNDRISQCDNHIKNENNARQSMKEVEQFKNHVGYGCRTPARKIITSKTNMV